MVFLKRSITALLVFFFFFLTSILISEKTYAQESTAETKCPMAQFLVIGNENCSITKNESSDFFPKKTLTQTLKEKGEGKGKEEKEEHIFKIAIIKNNNYTQTESQQKKELSADVLFEMINAYRQKINKPSFEKEAQVCSIAQGRKEEIVTEIFLNGNLHAGFWSDNHPFYATENIIWQKTEEDAINWWLNSPVHRSAIEGDYLYACGVCNGNVCSMIFSSLIPKASDVSINSNPSVKTEITKHETLSAQEVFSKNMDIERIRLSAFSQMNINVK